MSNKPIIFLAFANDKEDNARYLRNLPREMDGIRKALQKAVQAGLCEVIERANVTIENILDIFQDSNYKDRIAVLHYGGHADGYQLLLEQIDGSHAVAQGEGLVSFFAKQKGLKLVFFNGCSTQQQSLELVAAGIPAVIGTSNSINDDIATDLAIRFYKAIGNGANLERAWNEAIDQVKIQQGTANLRGLYRKQETALITDRFPWEILWREGAEIIKNWNLPETVDNPLFGLPEIIQTHLPEKPYRFLERYKREDAEIFFGRSYYIRDLYNRATDKNAAPVILLYGQSGVGKSSLLDAGLLPRLNQVANVCYIRRDPALGLLDTFKKALGISPLIFGENLGVEQNTQNITNSQNNITSYSNEITNSQNSITSYSNEITNSQNNITSYSNKITSNQNSITNSSLNIINKQIELISLALKITEEPEKQALNTLLLNLEQKRLNTYTKNTTTYQNNKTDLLTIWKSKEKDLPFIILLDQAEECFTRINTNLPNELEVFLAEIQKIFSDPQNQPEGKLILSYRKEYHPEIKEVFKTFSIPREEIFLKSISKKDIIEIVKGLTLTEKLRRTYRLNIEETLPVIIADDLLEDKESPIAPVLQILLTKMWQLSEQEELRYFSVRKYQELKQQGILMDDFFHEQMTLLAKQFPELMEKGLPLDILNYHTTKLGTADSKNLDELRERYSDRQEIVSQLIQQCKDLYLLSDASLYKTGLAHDTLAPIIQREFRNSNKAGQRAAIILENKLIAFEQNKETYIDVDDLRIVEQGKSGMKFWTKKEQELIDKSKERKRLLEEKEKHAKRLKNILFTTIAVVGILSLLLAGFAFQQYKEADLQKQAAQKNFEQADKLVNAFYFAYDKFALAFKDSKFYFIDKNGNKVDKLGEWDNVEQFSSLTNFAKVKNRNTNFLLDTLGRSYRVAYDLKDLNEEVLALDLSYKNLKEFPIEILANPQLEVLNLMGNQFESFPDEIGNLKKLKILDSRSCKLLFLPSEIGALDSLTSLNLSDNKLSFLPKEIGKLKSLEKLNLEANLLKNLPIQFGELNNLTHLYLNGDSLQTFPVQISNLKNLIILNLDRTALTSLPKEIEKLTNLKELILSGNSLSILPNEIGNLTNLEILDVGYSQLTTLPATIGQLVNLKQLHLNDNKINQLPPSLGNLKKLQELNLYGNQLASLIAEIGGLESLEILQLNTNQLTILPKMTGLKKLKDLNLGYNQLKELPATIGDLKDVETIYLTNNKLQSLPKEINKLTNLKELNLNNNELQTLPSTIGNLEKLQYLSVMDNRLESLPSEIGKLKSMTNLSLNNNQLKKLPPELWKLSNLRSVDLKGNKNFDFKSTYQTLAGNPLKLIISTAANRTDIAYLIDELIIQLDFPTISLDEISIVKNLRELDLENDSLTFLPASIGKLEDLSEINLRGSKNMDWGKAIPVLEKIGKQVRFTVENTKEPTKEKVWVVVSSDYTILKLLAMNLPEAYYEEFDKIDFLYLGNQNLVSLPENITKLKNLKTLSLEGNPIPEQEREKIISLLPNCKITF